MLINQAEKIYLGNQEAQKVYLGSQLVWELPSVSEATFTSVRKNLSKSRNTPYIKFSTREFESFGVDPVTVTAITVNGERYDVTKVELSPYLIYFHIENAGSLELDGPETLTIHYRG